MTLAPEAHVHHPKRLYAWIDRPSVVTGFTSAFDFLGVTRWWDPRRFYGDADRVALMLDYMSVTGDLRRTYYATLRESGIEPEERESEDAGQGQFSFFESDEFRVG